ncbi:hypothetical protein JTE90_002687 [Oedothorax gibbosus]|uniref:Uncharacterized protein n=1 Tax=Oedothorax gibbosus TaxID=931172 RepID=A0AAV6TPW2_9ARAC|nr:hypothetical protein JTE90_002687 [Oedothorax gibbosus]
MWNSPAHRVLPESAEGARGCGGYVTECALSGGQVLHQDRLRQHVPGDCREGVVNERNALPDCIVYSKRCLELSRNEGLFNLPAGLRRPLYCHQVRRLRFEASDCEECRCPRLSGRTRKVYSGEGRHQEHFHCVRGY